MNLDEIIDECTGLINDEVSMDEIFEYIKDTTDLDPSMVINEIYKREIIGGK